MLDGQRLILQGFAEDFHSLVSSKLLGLDSTLFLEDSSFNSLVKSFNVIEFLVRKRASDARPLFF